MLYAHIAPDAERVNTRYQTCTEHSQSVAELAKKALSRLGLASVGEFAGLTHDMGKFTLEFNDYLLRTSRGEPTKRGSVIHSFAGVSYMLQNFHTANGLSAFEALACEIIAVSIGSHHGLFDLWDEHHRSGFDHRLAHQPEYDKQAISSFLNKCASQEVLENLFQYAAREINNFIQTRIMTCVHSNDEIQFSIGLLIRLLTSSVVDADRTDTRCFMQNTPPPTTDLPDWSICAKQINSFIETFEKHTPIQIARSMFSSSCAAAATNQVGLYRLDLPTGGGKTLAALRFAVIHAKEHAMHRVFYIAPLLSIIEQNVTVIQEALGDTLPILEHHSNILRDISSPEETSQAELLQETWNAPFIVTTFVQLLETLFSRKTSSVRRFHALCNSTIIIDEVQSLPPKTLSMFNCAINFLTKCCGTTIVLCSATQPPFDHQVNRYRMLPSVRLISEELLKQYSPLFHRTNIVDAGACSASELAFIAKEVLETVNNLLIICNTKREAAELFDLLTETSCVKLFHLSASMCMAHRKQVLSDLSSALTAKEKLICVSTQVIEAGIDISFESVIRLSAGLESIVQAAGRCNRHGENSKPQTVRIYRMKDEKLGSLREIREAQDALNSLLINYRNNPERYQNDLACDLAVRDYYASLYKAMPIGYQDFFTHGHTLFDLLTYNQQFAPEGESSYYLNQAFRTAGEWFQVFDSDSESVVVPYGEGSALIQKIPDNYMHDHLKYIEDLLQQVKPFTVTLPVNQIDRMIKNKMLYTALNGTIYILNKEYYDRQTGIKEGVISAAPKYC